MLEANWTVDLSEEHEDDEPDELEELRFKMGRGNDAIRTVKDEGEVITSPYRAVLLCTEDLACGSKDYP